MCSASIHRMFRCRVCRQCSPLCVPVMVGFPPCASVENPRLYQMIPELQNPNLERQKEIIHNGFEVFRNDGAFCSEAFTGTFSGPCGLRGLFGGGRRRPFQRSSWLEKEREANRFFNNRPQVRGRRCTKSVPVNRDTTNANLLRLCRAPPLWRFFGVLLRSFFGFQLLFFQSFRLRCLLSGVHLQLSRTQTGKPRICRPLRRDRSSRLCS